MRREVGCDVTQVAHCSDEPECVSGSFRIGQSSVGASGVVYASRARRQDLAGQEATGCAFWQAVQKEVDLEAKSQSMSRLLPICQLLMFPFRSASLPWLPTFYLPYFCMLVLHRRVTLGSVTCMQVLKCSKTIASAAETGKLKQYLTSSRSYSIAQ